MAVKIDGMINVLVVYNSEDADELIEKKHQMLAPRIMAGIVLVVIVALYISRLG